MTAFASANLDEPPFSLTAEIKSVNNRYLDLSFKLPDELRALETDFRELLNRTIRRGKVELRVQLQQNSQAQLASPEPEQLHAVRQLIVQARQYFPAMPDPSYGELLHLINRLQAQQASQDELAQLALKVVQQALDKFLEMRQREGARLQTVMLAYVQQIKQLSQQVQEHLPEVLQAQQDKIQQRLTNSLEQIAPEAFTHISGEELSARIATESSLFSIRSDVAEELTRLDSHCQELEQILNQPAATPQSQGKRMDFLFQEMNREVNTLGSKSASLKVTNAVIELKLLVDQLREQALNIE
ncbi:YicC/YloC family endoribonuclease [Brackiella oedipodis]|uniref:YicC/YloC family endoribonuclease n=1 Tax=Brackiella oedipodis TaxID=124225 RepID=UPI001FDF5A71|nr:YicC/YloC family endoribonuclease [Brackiella oedipodis]